MSVLVNSLTNISDHGLYRGEKENKKKQAKRRLKRKKYKKKNSLSVEDILTHLPEIS